MTHMTNDTQELIDQAASLERRGEWTAALRLYERIAEGDGQDAAYARRCVRIVRKRISGPDEAEPEVDTGLGKLLQFIGGGILAGLLAISSKGARHGDDAVRALRGVVKDGNNFQALRELDKIATPEDLLRNIPNGLPENRVVFDPVTVVNPPEKSKPIWQQIELKEVDTGGLTEELAELLGEKTESTSEAEWAVALRAGVRIEIITHSSRSEYTGQAGEDLNCSELEEDSEFIFSIGKLPPERTRNANRDVPDRDKGEFDRCRIRFSGDGRPYITFDTRTVTNDGAIDFRGSYELQCLDGKRDDFEAGKTLRFQFTPQGLDSFREEFRQAAERQLGSVLLRSLVGDASVEKYKDRIKFHAAIDEWPQSDIVASRTTLVNQDIGKSAMRIDVTLAAP